MSNIKNLLFDLGGVLLNIDYHQTARAFQQLGVVQFDQLYSQHAANDLFEQLETGQIGKHEFYTAMEPYCLPGTTHQQMEAAWNAILQDFRIPSVAFLEKLSGQYRLFLLSNTNAIHHEAFQESFVLQTGKASLDAYFEKAYYSHLIGKRKPYPSTYQWVLEDAGIAAEETLFIDDSFVNIEGAEHAGLRTHWLQSGELIEDLELWQSPI